MLSTKTMELKEVKLSNLVFHFLLAIGSVYSSPVSSSLTFTSSYSSSSLPVSSSSSSSSSETSCTPTEIDVCSIYSLVQMPNVYGDFSQTEAGLRLRAALKAFGSAKAEGKSIVTFFCTLYIPPCPRYHGDVQTSHVKNMAVGLSSSLPCQSMCQRAKEDSQRVLGTIDGDKKPWPVRCQTLPNDNCYAFLDDGGIQFVQDPAKPHQSKKKSVPTDEIVSFAPIDVEIGGSDESYEIEVVNLSSGKIPARRYDIADLGDPALFQGWVDVQGTGAANDYCRVVGKGKRRFLSCNLAGSTSQGHHFVSKLGFDVGHTNTWFMRDMDGDGRDDYCRCVSLNSSSKVSCMKAGEKGFYGSTTQGGSQHSFTLGNSGGCQRRVVNPMFGE